ncbi:MAG: Gfo/Idh/MocA family oxidoreductase [Fibrobacter sp.]|jgi:predicted dehydrogenase|nr:Gfo/Idh/MocA family oxidoreductase [Fibrobacter sp.]
MKKTEFRWGIFGTGNMARLFAEGLKSAPGAKLAAVASRDSERARLFAGNVGASKSFGSLEAMCADTDVDIIYIASPNHRHAPDTKTAILAGKAVVCEKPFALNAAEAESVIALARKKNVFLMEALWTEFLPSLKAFLNEVKKGSIGDPLLLQADFGFRTAFHAESRLFSPEQGGGSVYDIGIYPLYLSQQLFGNPEKVNAVSVKAPTGVDMTTLVQMSFPQGKLASLASSFAMDLDTEAHLFGTEGKLVLHRMFHMPTRLTLHRGREVSEISLPKETGNGYQYEAIAVMEALRQGFTECPDWNLSQTLNLTALIEKVLNSKAC